MLRSSIAIERVINDLRVIRESKLSPNILLGVSGKVATGKTRFSSGLRDAISTVFDVEVRYLPFDYWINIDNLASSTYADRFFLDEFCEALTSITRGEQWLCPRYDIEKSLRRSGEEKSFIFDPTEVVWIGRRFRKVNGCHGISDIAGGNGIYFDPDSERLFTLFLPKQSVIYFIDGTMVFANEPTKKLYDSKIFVKSSWVNRVARMVRRFNRREVFGNTALSEEEYVGFLVEEAVGCADQEIDAQLDDSMIIVESKVETISNLLDLYYLLDRIRRSPKIGAMYNLIEEEIEISIQSTLDDFSNLNNPQLIKSLKQELFHLAESAHLLAVHKRNKIFDRLLRTF